MLSPNATTSFDAAPLVIVQGFLGTAIFSWGSHINTGPYDIPRKVLVPKLGPVSSLHDRACELYYSLAGGRVDYGAQHSSRHRHDRYGRTFPVGLYPQWSVKHPLHFLGYSVGGPTVVKLQHLLQEGHFGKDSHPDIILSLDAVCCPFRGTQLVYTLGESMTAAPEVRPFSLGSFLAKLVHIIAYISPLLPAAFDIHADARALSYRESSILDLVKQLWKCDWAESQDAIPYDMTFEAARHREIVHEGLPYQNTYYRSHVPRMTYKFKSSPTEHQQRPVLRMSSFTHNLLYFWSRSIGNFDFRTLRPRPSFLPDLPVLCTLGEEYWANDGVVPIFSQWHPLACGSTACEHHKIIYALPSEGQTKTICPDADDSGQLCPGRWHVLNTDNGSNHLSLIPSLFQQNLYQRNFWLEYGHWLNAVDAHVRNRERQNDVLPRNL